MLVLRDLVALAPEHLLLRALGLDPEKVRAIILDGAIDPNADPIQADIDQAEAFQKAFDDYAADCAKDPDCPLCGTNPTITELLNYEEFCGLEVAESAAVGN